MFFVHIATYTRNNCSFGVKQHSLIVWKGKVTDNSTVHIPQTYNTIVFRVGFVFKDFCNLSSDKKKHTFKDNCHLFFW